jgi:hypothetical protein
VILVALLAVSYKVGKRPVISLILAVYPSLLIFQYFPYVSFESGRPEAFAFVVIYIMTFVAITKSISNKKLHTPVRKITDYGLLTLSYIALVISVSNNAIPALKNLYTLSGFLPNLINNINFGLLLIMPLIVILITRKSDKY